MFDKNTMMFHSKHVLHAHTFVYFLIQIIYFDYSLMYYLKVLIVDFALSQNNVCQYKATIIAFQIEYARLVFDV